MKWLGRARAMGKKAREREPDGQAQLESWCFDYATDASPIKMAESLANCSQFHFAEGDVK